MRSLMEYLPGHIYSIVYIYPFDKRRDLQIADQAFDFITEINCKDEG